MGDDDTTASTSPPPPHRRLLGALRRAPARVLRRGGGARVGADGPLASLSGSAAAEASYEAPAVLQSPPPPSPPPPLNPLEAAAAAASAALDSALAAAAAALPPWLPGVGGAASAWSSAPPPLPGLSAADRSWREAGCFPSRIAPPPEEEASAPAAAAAAAAPGAASPRTAPSHHHHLAAVGTRAFTLAGMSLRIYDFGVYVCPASAAASPALDASAADADALAFSRALRSADDVPKTLLVRTRRALPLPLMKAEYARILTRRIAMVGGDPGDAALAQLIGLFRQDVLPPSARGPAGMVRGGTVLEFTRSPGGRLSVALDGVRLADVASVPLAAAVFDIYLGADLPCCATAQAAASRRVAGWVAAAGGEGGPRRLGPAWRETVEAVEEEHEPGPLAPELVCGRRRRQGGKRCGTKLG